MGIRSIARELNLSPGQVSKLAARGMPVDDLEAAVEWRRKNLDPSWAKAGPPLGDGFEEILTTMIDDLLRRQVPPRLWQVEFLAMAATEAGIEARAEQLLDMYQLLVFLMVRETDRFLDDGGAGFKLPFGAMAVAGSPEYIATCLLIDQVRADVRANPLRKPRD